MDTSFDRAAVEQPSLFFAFTSKHRTIKRLVIDGAIAGQMNVSELARICDLSRPTVYKNLKMVG